MFKFASSKTFLAPLAGINDPAFRLMCEEQGAGLTFTELTSIDFIQSEKISALKLIERSSKERCVGLQLFGKHPEKIKDALSVVEDEFDFFDFNAGCPANNIIGQGAGAELLSNKVLLEKMLNELVSNTNKPVTLKYRLGINKNNENFLEIGKLAEDLGVSMLTLHARYASQGYSGVADWEKIKLLKEAVNIPVTGNGDVKSPEDAKRLFDVSNCDFVMVGRKAMGNPWIFSQINNFLNNQVYEEISDENKLDGFFHYSDLSSGFNVSFARFKIQAMQFTKGVVGAVNLRKEVSKARSKEEIINSIRCFLRK